MKVSIATETIIINYTDWLFGYYWIHVVLVMTSVCVIQLLCGDYYNGSNVYNSIVAMWDNTL